MAKGQRGRAGSTEWVHWESYGHVLAHRLRTLRRNRGLSQLRLAELAGVSRNLVSNLERNENAKQAPTDPVLSTIYRLAQALDVPPVALLPAVEKKVASVCEPGSLEVRAQWPENPTDLAAYTASHLALGKRGDLPEYVSRDND